VPIETSQPAVAPESASTSRIQTSVRLEPAMWAALNDLATRRRVETGRRVTVHDLLIECGKHILAVNGIKLSK
jgi:predicted DNA-binding ribbon-helix-helix protein